MKRFNCPHSMASLLYPPQEKKTRNSKYVYDQAFQTMLDDLDDDEEEEIDQHTEKKRRLCPGQVEALEKNFEVDNRLKPEKKTKLAQELGLKPRQIAIWFQNRRARWKGKQLEKDYNVLKSNYEALKINFDKLEKDNECLAKELIGLKEKLLKENRESNEAEALFWGSNVYFCESLDSREILTQFGEGEDQSCNIFSLDQAPTLHW